LTFEEKKNKKKKQRDKYGTRTIKYDETLINLRLVDH